MTLRWFALVWVLASSATSSGAPPSALEAEILDIARTSHATVGAFIEHIERGEIAAINFKRPFPLASTFKLPLSLAVLKAIETNQLPALDAKVRVEEADLLPGVSPLLQRMPKGGETTIRDLIVLVSEEGDNSAANVMMRLVGGGRRVRALLDSMGLRDISIDRDETEQALDSYGVPLPPRSERTPARILALTHDVPVESHRAAIRRFIADKRDHASPVTMANVIAHVWRGGILTDSDLAFVRAELARNKRGLNRIRAGVPQGIAVADRTGTCYGVDDDDAPCVNDVGIITLPSGEHVVVSVFVEGVGSFADKEHLIASITREVWRHYTSHK